MNMYFVSMKYRWICILYLWSTD